MLGVGGSNQRLDLLRRFTSTPYAADLKLMQRTVRLETDNEAMLALARQFFERHQYGETRVPEFVWRIVCESDPVVQNTAMHLSAFSDPGLRYFNIGQRSFVAVDLEVREAVAFLPDTFVGDKARFKHRPPLDILFCMTCASLRLAAISGGCVGIKDRGVIVFGPPNSGKTTASYLAAKVGMEFHADQVVFLDNTMDRVQVWGDPFPAVFRPETLDYLSEIRESAHQSTYDDLSFYYLDKSPWQEHWAKPVAPICSIFLDRRSGGQTQLIEISRDEVTSRLHNCMLFSEDSRIESSVADALDALSEKPAYVLQYAKDPRIAASILEKLVR